jgi:hypothetical protein
MTFAKAGSLQSALNGKSQDATCTPADIKYPTDIGILNEAREKTEKIIDKLYKEIKEKKKEKPRTYREKGRKDYLGFAE